MLLIVTLVAAPSLAADAGKPHPHQGIVDAYEGAPSKPELTAEDLAALAGGGSVLKQAREGSGGRGIAVQDVAAPPDVVWDRILDFGAYPRMVEGVKTCEIYERSGDHVKARFVISAPLVTVEYFVDHVHPSDEGWMTWTLDYSRESDLDDSVGFWRVEALEDGRSRVFYSVDVRIKGWVPPIIENIIVKQGLTKATEWVKRESEAQAAR